MNITLLPPDPAFAESFFKWRQDQETIKYNPLAPATIESIRERLTKASSNLMNFNKSESFLWFVSFENKVVGHISLQNINRMMLTAEIGYTMDPQMRAKGLATAAVRLLTKNAFEKTPLRKLLAYVHENNLASIRVLEKVGYKQEGLLREHYLINGIATNEAIFGILRQEVM